MYGCLILERFATLISDANIQHLNLKHRVSLTAWYLFPSTKGEYLKGHIEEYFRACNGEGIQDIAFSSDDFSNSSDQLQAASMQLMKAPKDSVYDMLESRFPGHGEAVEVLRKRGVPMDGSTANNDSRLLLQIFSNTVIGPVFFEHIGRKKDVDLKQLTSKHCLNPLGGIRLNAPCLKRKLRATVTNSA